IVPDLHIARACEGYPYAANEDNCDPPNRADRLNPPQDDWTDHFISRGVTLKIPYPYGFTPHRARYIDPETGAACSMVVVPAADAMGWDEGYALFGTGPIDAIAWANDPARPMLILFAHDGDNAWSGGYSYYNENVTQFCHQAAAAGYRPTTIATYLSEHPVPAGDIVHVEDGGWVNADGDFGSPQYINWNWPLVNAAGAFDIANGWAEDERNWAVLTAAQNRVETAAEISGAVDPARVVDPLSGADAAERAWHFLLAGYESGYMYYGTALDMEVKATLACNEALEAADPVIAAGSDETPPTVWLPQRLPWNPGGYGGGSLWGYPGGEGAPMGSDFHVWTFAYDVSGLVRVELMIREDADGWNDPSTTVNETYAGGSGVGAWQPVEMTARELPLGEPWEMPAVDFTELPAAIATEYWAHLTGYSDVLLDYYVEAQDATGRMKRTPIQHVYVGESPSGEFIMDGSLDAGAQLVGAGGGLSLWAAAEGGRLYLATEATGSTANLDHFLLVLDDTTATRGSPWAKAGTVRAWDYYLGAENDNGWHGWFDAGESVRAGAAFGNAQGAVLEGTLDLAALYGEIPERIWLCAAGYATPDAGALLAQAPAGNGNGNLEGGEYYLLELGAEALETMARVTPSWHLVPEPGVMRGHAVLRLSLPEGSAVRVEVFDANGRRVAKVFEGTAGPGDVRLTWDGTDEEGHPARAGVYYFRASGAGGGAKASGVLLR
ncbi:MAG: FlgD immunoglobulin-like domain containing protein, partial [Candidatus Eisenbacteria bacterium]